VLFAHRLRSVIFFSGRRFTRLVGGLPRTTPPRPPLPLPLMKMARGRLAPNDQAVRSLPPTRESAGERISLSVLDKAVPFFSKGSPLCVDADRVDPQTAGGCSPGAARNELRGLPERLATCRVFQRTI